MSNLSDLLLLGGVALCAISVIAAIVQVLQSQAPRGAVITLVLGILLIFGGAYTSPEPLQPQSVLSAWHRVVGGKDSTTGDAATSTAEPAEADGEAEAPAN